jgi:hypothetical protein
MTNLGPVPFAAMASSDSMLTFAMTARPFDEIKRLFRKSVFGGAFGISGE